jgi:methyltransferase (TIGR00027 family)
MSDAAPPASLTALWAAKQRALHQIHGAEPKILADPIAASLLGADFDRAELPVSGAGSSSVVLRSRWSEDALAAAVEQGASQLVILGAGLDTFAYRQPAWAGGIRVFEVDHHASQEDKRRRLRAAGVPLPANLEFVPIDFERTTLRDGLKASSLDFDRKTFFSCLGVMGYLTTEAVMAIFRVVAEFPTGSAIAFTFFTARPPAEVSSMTSRVGETLLSHFRPDEIARDLRGMGFSGFDLMSPSDAERRYFQDRADGLTVPEWPAMAVATVGGWGP